MTPVSTPESKDKGDFQRADLALVVPIELVEIPGVNTGVEAEMIPCKLTPTPCEIRRVAPDRVPFFQFLASFAFANGRFLHRA